MTTPARLRACLAALVAVGALFAAASPATAQMPDPALMHGRAIPAPELAAGTVTVRVVREAIGNDAEGQVVRLTTGSASREATTDAQGRAEFPNLQTGIEGRAEVTVDGEPLVSQPFMVPTAGGLRVILVAGLDKAAARRQQEAAAAAAEPPVKGTVTLGGNTRILMEFRDDSLQVFYMLEIVNGAAARVDIGGPLVITLPTGAAGVSTIEGSAPATINGARVTVQGPFASGNTLVQVGFTLRYNAADISLSQHWPVATQQIAVGLERVGDVTLSSPQFTNVGDVQAEDGTPYFLATSPAMAAGSDLRIDIGNLPVASALPRYVGLALAAAVLALGAFLAFTGRARGNDTHQRLVHRRDTLLGELAQLQQRERQDGGLDARAAQRQQRLVAELEQIYGELDEAGGRPEGGGEGIAA